MRCLHTGCIRRNCSSYRSWKACLFWKNTLFSNPGRIPVRPHYVVWCLDQLIHLFFYPSIFHNCWVTAGHSDPADYPWKHSAPQDRAAVQSSSVLHPGPLGPQTVHIVALSRVPKDQVEKHCTPEHSHQNHTPDTGECWEHHRESIQTAHTHRARSGTALLRSNCCPLL